MKSLSISNPDQNASRILIIEDDPYLNEQLSELVGHAGYQSDCCFDGEQGLITATSKKPDLILLDVMLPKRDGLSVLRILRKSSQVPVIMLTAKDAEQEKISGFTHGADDYVAKPFNSTELMLRIEALLRRSRYTKNEVEMANLNIDELCVDTENQLIQVNETVLELTSIQYKLLYELIQHQSQVMSKAYLYQKVLNKTMGAHDRSLDMHLSRVRRKLTEAGWRGERLATVHGKGYCIQ